METVDAMKVTRKYLSRFISSFGEGMKAAPTQRLTDTENFETPYIFRQLSALKEGSPS